MTYKAPLQNALSTVNKGQFEFTSGGKMKEAGNQHATLRHIR